MARLNGWQRLWVVFTFLWVALFAVIGLAVRESVLLMTGFAVGPPVFLYSAGLAVAWIRRGFYG